MTGPGNRETRLSEETVEELAAGYLRERAARVRAEEALRRLREFIKNDCEAARIIDAALSTTPAGCKCPNDPNGLLAAVPEENK